MGTRKRITKDSTISFRVDGEIKAALKRQARIHRRSMSSYVVWLIMEQEKSLQIGSHIDK